MRKQVFGRQLGRDKNQRQALFKSLIRSLIERGEIETTISKAKAIKPQAEKIISKAKRGSLNDRRSILQVVGKRSLANKLIEEIAPLFKQKNGGYLRIIRTDLRKGDSAQMAKMMFTEELKEKKEDLVEPEGKVPPKKKKRKVQSAKRRP